MNPVIVFTHPDGTCGVVRPAPEMFDKDSRTRTRLARQGVTFKRDADVLRWIAEKDVPPGLPWRIVDRDKLPADRTFRDAWTDDNPTNTVDVDMGKAREIHMSRLRAVRDEKLKALDLDYMRADEAGNAKAKKDIAAKKQALRDLPQAVDLTAFDTPEALAAFAPAELDG